MRGMLAVSVESSNIYVMHNSRTNATIECTQGYIPQWLARGFEVVEIRLSDDN